MGEGRLPLVRIRTSITWFKKKGRYLYAYIRIPAALKPFVMGRSFDVEVEDGRVVYRLCEDGAYRPIKNGNSIYIRFPVDNISVREVDILPIEDGFMVIMPKTIVVSR